MISERGVHAADIFVYQGACLFSLQKLSEAIHAYEQALEIDENFLDALKGLCQCLLTVDENTAPPKVFAC